MIGGSTCMATAVDDSARPPPSTIAAGPLTPVTAITVYATTASVAHTCDRAQKGLPPQTQLLRNA